MPRRCYKKMVFDRQTMPGKKWQRAGMVMIFFWIHTDGVMVAVNNAHFAMCTVYFKVLN